MSCLFETIEFDAYNGVRCNLLHIVNERAHKCSVLLVHGAGVRANIFNPPTENNIIEMLVRKGYNVWLENWRGNIDLLSNQWDLDRVAINDHPVAVKTIVKKTGVKEMKNDRGVDIWLDTTTLFKTVYEGNSDTGSVIGKGKLKIGLGDLAKQLTTMRSINTQGGMSDAKATLLLESTLQEMCGTHLLKAV